MPEPVSMPKSHEFLKPHTQEVPMPEAKKCSESEAQELPMTKTHDEAHSHHGAPMTTTNTTFNEDDTLPGFSPEEFARIQLTSITSTLAHDEVRVLTHIAERLQGGRVAYGPLDLATDSRRFRDKEAREEVEDALVYLACAWLKGQEVAS
jgi:hypothetical protein